MQRLECTRVHQRFRKLRSCVERTKCGRLLAGVPAQRSEGEIGASEDLGHAVVRGPAVSLNGIVRPVGLALRELGGVVIMGAAERSLVSDRASSTGGLRAWPTGGSSASIGECRHST